MAMREYPPAQVIGVHRHYDGDTFWLWVDTMYRSRMLVEVRLAIYDTPELRGPDTTPYERRMANEALALTASFLDEALETPDVSLWIMSQKDPERYGRWLSVVWREAADGSRRTLGAELRQAGLASIYPRRWREEFGV